MNYTWYENEPARGTCEICQKKFRTSITINGHLKTNWCKKCTKYINNAFSDTEYTTEKMNKAIDELQKMAGLIQ